MTELDFPSPPQAVSAPRRRFSPLLAALIVLTLIGAGSTVYGVSRIFGYQRQMVSSEAMSPAFEPRTMVVTRSVNGADVHRGDVIVFDRHGYDQQGDQEYAAGLSVFRVVGVGKDTVACCAGSDLTVNGKPVHEPYLSTGKDSKGPFATQPFTAYVPTGTVFVAGDNRGNAADSRVRGPLNISAVRGVVVATGDVLNPKSFTPTTAFTDAGLPGAPNTDDGYLTIRWFLAGGGLVFLLGFIGVLVFVGRSAGRRRKAAAVPPVR